MQTEFIKIITFEYNDLISCFIWLKKKKKKAVFNCQYTYYLNLFTS